MTNPRVYFARAVSLYGTPQDDRDITVLRAFGFEVVDPNRDDHQEGYARDGMDYFVALAASADAIAFRANPDGSIPAGVSKEVLAATEEGMPVLELPCGIHRRTLSVEATREYLRDVGCR